MSRRDLYHTAVVNALKKARWVITDDPLILDYGRYKLQVDLGAEPRIGAEKNGEKIALEIKSFIGASAIQDFYLAIGQYSVYREILLENELPHILYLAIPSENHAKIFKDELGSLIVRRLDIKLMIFDETLEEVIEWRN